LEETKQLEEVLDEIEEGIVNDDLRGLHKLIRLSF